MEYINIAVCIDDSNNIPKDMIDSDKQSSDGKMTFVFKRMDLVELSNVLHEIDIVIVDYKATYKSSFFNNTVCMKKNLGKIFLCTNMEEQKDFQQAFSRFHFLQAPVSEKTLKDNLKRIAEDLLLSRKQNNQKETDNKKLQKVIVEVLEKLLKSDFMTSIESGYLCTIDQNCKCYMVFGQKDVFKALKKARKAGLICTDIYKKSFFVYMDKEKSYNTNIYAVLFDMKVEIKDVSEKLVNYVISKTQLVYDYEENFLKVIKFIWDNPFMSMKNYEASVLETRLYLSHGTIDSLTKRYSFFKLKDYVHEVKIYKAEERLLEDHLKGVKTFSYEQICIGYRNTYKSNFKKYNNGLSQKEWEKKGYILKESPLNRMERLLHTLTSGMEEENLDSEHVHEAKSTEPCSM